MKKYWKAIGLIALAAGVLYYPAMRMYRSMNKKLKENEGNEGHKAELKQFLSQHKRGKKNRTLAASNGHVAHT